MLKDTAKSPNWKLAHARIREAWEIFPLSFLWATSLTTNSGYHWAARNWTRNAGGRINVQWPALNLTVSYFGQQDGKSIGSQFGILWEIIKQSDNTIKILFPQLLPSVQLSPVPLGDIPDAGAQEGNGWDGSPGAPFSLGLLLCTGGFISIAVLLLLLRLNWVLALQRVPYSHIN